jgi:hypothetical protein
LLGFSHTRLWPYLNSGRSSDLATNTVCQRVTHAEHQAIETSENEPIDVAEDKALRRLTPKHVDLVAKNENFGLQGCAGPEQAGHKAPK